METKMESFFNHLIHSRSGLYFILFFFETEKKNQTKSSLRLGLANQQKKNKFFVVDFPGNEGRVVAILLLFFSSKFVSIFLLSNNGRLNEISTKKKIEREELISASFIVFFVILSSSSSSAS